jgi:hypothetical protein
MTLNDPELPPKAIHAILHDSQPNQESAQPQTMKATAFSLLAVALLVFAVAEARPLSTSSTGERCSMQNLIRHRSTRQSQP